MPQTTTDQQPMSYGQALGRGLVSAATDNDDVGPGVRTVAVAFMANLVVALAKYAGFLLVQSSALLAEAFHSTATTANQALLLRGRLVGDRAEDAQHPFGYGRARYFWAFVVAIVMFGIGSTLSIGRGVLALLGPGEGIGTAWIPLAALTVGLLSDGSSFLVAFRQTRRERGDHGYFEHLRRSKDPEVMMVFMEDFAALIGLAFAYTGVILTLITGNHVYDAVASICIGLLLAAVAFFLAREMRSLLLGESALPEHQEQLVDALGSHPAVDDVVYVRTLHLGPEDLLVEAKAEFRDELHAGQVADAIDEVEAEMRNRLDIVRLVAIEPDRGEPDTDRPAYQLDR